MRLQFQTLLRVVLTGCLTAALVLPAWGVSSGVCQDLPLEETSDTLSASPPAPPEPEAPPAPPTQATTGPEELLLGDAVFEEVYLSLEGVVGVDSLGNRWQYDFADDIFIRDHLASTGTAGAFESPDDFDPVEIRCTTELHLSRPALDPVYVGYTEYVEEDIIANDRVTVDGWVKGDIHSFTKLVLVTASGRVDGDIRAPEIEIKDGAIVLGEAVVTPPLAIPRDLLITSFSAAGIWVVFGLTLFLLLVAFLAASLAPRHLSRIDTCIDKHTVRSLAIGIVTLFLLPALVALLALTVVGVLVLPLALVIVLPVALVAGMTWSSRAITRPLLRMGDGRGQGGLLFQSIVGVLLFMLIWTVVAILLGSSDAIALGFGYFFLVVSILLTSLPLFLGVGATVLTRLGFREYAAKASPSAKADAQAPTPAPPPMPSSDSRPTWSGQRPIPRPPHPQPPPARPPHSGDNQ